MFIYVVVEIIWYDHESKTSLLAAFTNEEKAQQYVSKLPDNSHRYWSYVEQIELL